MLPCPYPSPLGVGGGKAGHVLSGWGRRGELGRVGTRAPQVSHPQADNTGAGVGISSSAHRGDAGFAHVLPRARAVQVGGGTLSLSSTGSSSTGLAHPSCLVRQAGLGILLLTLPTAG